MITIIKIIDKLHLVDVIQQEIKLKGTKCDLNHLDVSEITNMSDLFEGSKFTGDISGWNTSSFTDIGQLFEKSKFKGDISKLDAHNIKKIDRMFWDCLAPVPHWAKY